MTIRPRAIRLLHYLEAVRHLREQPVRDIGEYQDRRWRVGDIPAHSPCVLTSTGGKPRLMASNRQIPLAPPLPKGVAVHLRAGITEPTREPTDFDHEYAGLRMSATFTVAKAADDRAADALDRLAPKSVRSH